MTASRMDALRPTLVVFLLAGGMVWAYFPVLREMAGKWFTDPQYSHAYLVPLFSVYLLWRNRDQMKVASMSPSWWGLGVLFLGVGLRLSGTFYHLAWLEAISLLPTLVGVALTVGGVTALRWTWLAIVFLFFMIPLPHRIETSLSAELQNLATTVSTYTLQTLGWPAFREGNIIFVNESRIGIVEACNGLGMMILFFALATGFAIVIDRPWPDKVILILSAVPIAVLSNVLRILVTTILYETAGKKWGDLVFHDLAGWLMMPVALGMLYLELKTLSWLLVEVPEADYPTVNLDSPSYSAKKSLTQGEVKDPAPTPSRLSVP